METTVDKIATLEDAERVMNKLQSAKAKKDIATGEANREIVAIRNPIVTKLGELEEFISNCEAELKRFTKWAYDKQRGWFGGSKTINLHAGQLTLSEGKQTIELALTEEEVVARALANKFEDIVRQPPMEINKQVVLAKITSGELTTENLRKLGIRQPPPEDSVAIKLTTVDKVKGK